MSKQVNVDGVRRAYLSNEAKRVWYARQRAIRFARRQWKDKP